MVFVFFFFTVACEMIKRVVIAILLWRRFRRIVMREVAGRACVKEGAQGRAQLTTSFVHRALRILAASGTAVTAVLVAVLGAGRRRAVFLRLAFFLLRRAPFLFRRAHRRLGFALLFLWLAFFGLRLAFLLRLALFLRLAFLFLLALRMLVVPLLPSNRSNGQYTASDQRRQSVARR
jgi:hypothetical protein